MMMLNLTGYQQTNKIYAGSRTLVYRAIRATDRQSVIIKVLRNPHPNFNELLQFRNQYVITSNLEQPTIVRPLALERYGHGYALVMPDEGAIALSDYWQQLNRNFTEFLSIAIQLAEALHHLSQQRIIHKDIKPTNILIHPETKQVKLIDFSISSLLPKEQQQLINPNVLEGTLAYISPEQTGRMNRGIDYRTDFYSLGVTFFELLTGELPFATSDPMELVHCHIAKPATFPKTKEAIPQTLVNIVLKLMAKNAEDRYQSALGLKHDLERCLQQLEATGTIETFELGEGELYDRFIIPEKLYGREMEVQTILDAFERVANGATEMILVAGFSGIGKTAVVNEVHKPIVKQRGYFIKGKFDQFNRNIPFSAFVEAFRSLMGQLLSESDVQLQKWKAKILSALGDNAQVIIEVIPELKYIIGQQPPVPELSGSAAQNRFNLLFGKFTQVFTTKDHPLVIFLDDLQWADSASLNLLQLLMGEGDKKYLLVLGAYRDNEVFPTHPLMLLLEEIGKIGTAFKTITLKSLTQEDLNHLVAETMMCSPEQASALTELVYQKTKGNPFFATQFLKGFYEDGEIIFNSEVGCWQCDMVRLRQLTLTDDIIEFMALQLRKLPSETQNVLKLAACIGNSFDLGSLAVVCEQPEAEVAVTLWHGLQEGFLLPQSELYKFYQFGESDRSFLAPNSPLVTYNFLHDRIQQAAYLLIPEHQKQATHLKIGQLLLNTTHESEQEANIFTIVNQLNVAIDLITVDAEKLQLARLNLVAGKKAKASTAYAAASEYLALSLRLLPSDCWISQYNLTLDCYINAIESEYLNTNFERAGTLAEIVLENAKVLLDRVRIYELKISMHVARLEMMAAMELGLKVLEMLEITFVEAPPDILDVETLIDLPELTASHNLAVMRILMSLISSAYFADPSLLPKIIFTMISRSLDDGNSLESAYGYVVYGLLLCGPLQEIEIGYRYGKLALKLLDKFDAKEIRVRILLVFNGNIRHWKEHIKTTLNPLQEAIQVGLEVGDIEYAGYASTNSGDQTLAIGEPLDSMEKKRQGYLNLMSDLKQEYSIQHHSIGLQLVQNLLGKTNFPYLLIGEAFDEQKMLPILLESRNAGLLFNLYLAKGRLCYLFQRYVEALNYLDLATEYMASVAGMVTVGEQNFYNSLAALAVTNEQPEELQQAIERVEANQRAMQSWATHAPVNYQHKYDLVAAEQYRILGEKIAAMELYDRAIAGAKENEYLQEEALANELAAKFYLDWGKEKFAVGYMQAAYSCYAQWGAKAKNHQLQQTYPQLLATIHPQPEPLLNSSNLATDSKTLNTVTTTASVFDFASAIKAFQVISGEIELDALLSKLMHIILENAGADQGALILNNSDTWEIVAQCVNGNCHLSHNPYDNTNNIPNSIINTVKQTQQTIAIDNIEQDPTFIADPYFIQQQPKSVFCTPILKQGKLIGILYLENHLTAGAFTSDHIEILKLLTAQAAISIENARLYGRLEDYSHNLETEVEQRTQELQEKNQHLEQTLQQLQRTQAQLIQIEKMSSLGQLVAGIAHEINNPITFIAGNISHARKYFLDLLDLLAAYEQNSPHPSLAVKEKLAEIDLEFLQNDLEKLFNSMETGSDRIRKIVLGLRNFSRLDQSGMKRVDIQEGLENTLMILQHRLKPQGNDRPEIKIVKNYGELSLVNCYPSQLNQVFLHILSNAIDVLTTGDAGDRLEISITTEMRDSQTVRIRIADTGPGMSESVCQQVFNPFFTTKPVGQGTGLGLSISYQIITEQHRGELQCFSQPGQGTEFIIEIPI